MPHYDLIGGSPGGSNPAASVPDPNCRAHELDNPSMTDASFLPASGAVNPTLTIIADALRVTAHLAERLRVAAHLEERLRVAAHLAERPGVEAHLQERLVA